MQGKSKAKATTFRMAILATTILLLLLTAIAASAATITVDDGGHWHNYLECRCNF